MKLSNTHHLLSLSVFCFVILASIEFGFAQGGKIDLVKFGQDKFKSLGCTECHSLDIDVNDVKTGPSLHGVFQEKPVMRELIEAGEKHLIKVTADLNYLKSSVREPASELSINGTFSDPEEAIEKAYLPIMPAYDKKVVSDFDIEAIWHYLKTQNKAKNAGPKSVMRDKPTAKKTSQEDSFNELVAIDRPLIVRAPIEGMSARAIHVGQPNGVNYSFDPRTLAIEQVWYGGFINSAEETKNRATKLTKLGKNAQLVGKNLGLFRPLDDEGKPIDFTVSSPVVNDWNTINKLINSDKDFADELSSVPAQFRGYRVRNDKVTFLYEVEDDSISISPEISETGQVNVVVIYEFSKEHVLKLGDLIKEVTVSAGKVEGNQWILPKSNEMGMATLSGQLPAPKKPIWRPNLKPGSLDKQVVVESPVLGAEMLAGYTGTSITPPKDRLGREQLFEPTAMAVSEDGTIVIGTRTAGIWRIRDNQWTQFVDHSYECLGLVIEDVRGDTVVIGQKAELTRIIDTDNDGRADVFETLADNFRFTGNYHEYLHGPVRDGNGNYYFSLNLGHYHKSKKEVFKAGGKYMGTVGGYRGWMLKGSKKDGFKPYAHGFRSPAGLAMAPDQTIWYADNQGEFMGSSKLFKVKEEANYGHPSSAIDFPGMRRLSKEISDFSDWPKLKNWPKYPEVERAYGVFPHSDLANAPGSPAWVPKEGEFGVLDGVMLCGDQTRSSLFSMSILGTDEHPQTSFTPLFDKLPSGVMRLAFTPDGSLLVGQTGRGWRALGGQQASLVRLRWDRKTKPSMITKIEGKSDSLEVHFSKEFTKDIDVAALAKSIQIESYYYESSQNYGSKKLDAHKEEVKATDVSVSDDILVINLDKDAYALSKFGQRLFKVTLKNAKSFLNDHEGNDELSSFLSWTIKE